MTSATVLAINFSWRGWFEKIRDGHCLASFVPHQACRQKVEKDQPTWAKRPHFRRKHGQTQAIWLIPDAQSMHRFKAFLISHQFRA
jgi:hypothetical protein